MHQEELVELFNEEFTTPREISLSNFLQIHFKRGDDVIDYYHKKLHVVRNLELDAKLIEGLTAELPKRLKQLVSNSPQIAMIQPELMHKLTKLQISDDTDTKNIRLDTTNCNVNPQYPLQWKPQRLQTEYTLNPQLWSYREPFNNPRPFSPLNGRFTERGPRPINPNGNDMHYTLSGKFTSISL